MIVLRNVIVSLIALFALSVTVLAEDRCKPLAADNTRMMEAAAWLEQSEVIDAVLLEHCGKLVFERYFNGFGPEVAHDMQSATKTFTGLLAGIAIDKGIIKSIDQLVSELFPDYRYLLNDEKAKITVRHLLEMTSGLKWVDFGEQRSFSKQARSADSVAFILGEPLVSPPGESYFYNTGSSHLLSAVIHHNAGMTTADFAEKYLFGPLGFANVVWNRHGDGVHEGGWQLFLRPRDALKFGRIMMSGGRFNDKQLVSEDFINTATSYLNDSGLNGAGYGYQLWVVRDMGRNDLYGARGWGGQNVLVIKDLNAVIVTNGDILRNAEASEDIGHLIKKLIIPALENSN